MNISSEEIEVIRHSLGLNKKVRWSFRNYYYGESGVCEGLVKKGMMITRRGDQRYYSEPFYHVTDDGIKAAGVWHKVRKADRLISL